MGTTAEKLQAIVNSKNAIKTAIINKGGSITDSTPLDEYATAISSIPSGGGSEELNKLIDRSITSITTDIQTIGPYAFAYCTSLQSATLNGTLGALAYAFNTCSALTNFTANSLRNISIYTFAKCSALESINLPQLSTWDNYAFQSCDKLKTVTLGTLSGNIPNGVFYNCPLLTTINWTLPASYTIGQQAFYNCSSIEHLNFSGNTGSIQIRTFQACTSLIDIDLGNATAIGSYSFTSCTALQSITLRKSDSICTLQGIDAFSNIVNPITVYVPSDLISTYQTATNWSTLYNNNRVTFVAIPE